MEEITFICPEKLIIQQFGTQEINEKLEQIDYVDGYKYYLAIQHYRGGSIFYRIRDGLYESDFLNGTGFVVSKYKTIEDLQMDLNVAGYYLVDIDILRRELEISELQQGEPRKLLQKVQDRVKAQFDAVEMRANAEEKTEQYWHGQKDAFLIVTHIIRELTCIN